LRGGESAVQQTRSNTTEKEVSAITPSERRRIGYARVSTQDQTLALQLDALKAAGCVEIFQDHAVSGASTSRPGLTEALSALELGDTLVVWRLDRLGRSLRHLIETLTTLSNDGIGFHSIHDAIDTNTAGGRLTFHIMGALAEFERDLISERTKAGMAAAKARGVHVGRPSRRKGGGRV
jgi:DNA invertase Pin-like site-specific DNA recombinase